MALTESHGTVGEGQAGRVDLFVRTFLPLSRSKLNAIFANGCVTLNDAVCTVSETRVKTGDHVTVRFDPHQGYTVPKRPWSDRTFSIVDEDDSQLVVNKAAGALTVPTNKQEPHTLLERVNFYLKRTRKNQQAHLIHRLDRSMSGLIVFAKKPQAAEKLRSQFDSELAERKYLAIVHGVLREESGTFESWLATHGNLNQYSTHDRNQGQHAVTQFQVLKRMPDATAVELTIKTGRRHQPRVHLFEAGHRIVGESRYLLAEDEPHPRWKSKRLGLHATGLTFHHPENDQLVTYSCELPEPMKKFLRFRPLGGNLEEEPNQS